MLPCGKCRDNFRQHWQQFELREHLASRAQLIEWLILVHGAVNEEVGAPPLDYAAYMNRLTGTDAVALEADDASDEATTTTPNSSGQENDAETEATEQQTSGDSDGTRATPHARVAPPPKPASSLLSKSAGGALETSRHQSSNSALSSSPKEVSSEHRRNAAAAKAFAAAALFGETPASKMDPRRVRGRQAAAFELAARYRASNASNGASTPQFTTSSGGRVASIVNTKKHAGRRASSIQVNSGNSTGSSRFSSAWPPSLMSTSGGSGNGSTALERALQMAGVSGNSKSSKSSNTLRKTRFNVKPPRQCPNCSRQPLMPSLF